MTRLRVAVLREDATGHAEAPAASRRAVAATVVGAGGHRDLVDVRPLPDAVHLVLVPAGLLGDAAHGGTRARFVVVLGDPTGLDPARVAAAADAVGADLVVARWSPTAGGAAAHGAAKGGSGTTEDDAGTVLRTLVDALVGGAVLGDALVAALGGVTPLIGDASLLGWTDLGALLDPFGGRGAGASAAEMAAPPARRRRNARRTRSPDDGAV